MMAFPLNDHCADGRASQEHIRRAVRFSSGMAFVLLLGGGLAQAQASGGKPKAGGLRALAVVELAAPVSGKIAGEGRLHPVCVYQNGNYTDATIYDVNPVPLATEPGTVYEMERSGNPLALFTVEDAARTHGDWVGKGTAQAIEAEASSGSTSAKNKKKKSAGDDERPVLHRGGSKPDVAAENSANAPPPPASGGNSNAAGSAEGSSRNTNEAEPPSDPNRPVLRRGKPANKASADTQIAASSVAAPAAAKPTAEAGKSAGKMTARPPQPALHRQFFAAISDASAGEPHSYDFSWTGSEQARLKKAMAGMAVAEIESKLRGAKLVSSDANSWEQLEVRAFDLFNNNDGELVLSGARRATMAGAGKKREITVYVLLVASIDYSGQPQKAFSEITDDNHLDVKGRMELVDAVDADGDGRGELLFRRVGESSEHYELYRLVRGGLWKLFEGAEISE